MFKIKITKCLLLIFSFCLSAHFLFAQTDLCDGCYVWSFTNDKGERDESTRLLTDAVEDIISQYPSCTLLQRSRFAKLQEQIANEKAIQSLNFAPSVIKDELKVIKAKRVIFGAISRDFQGSVSLRLTFESLINSQFKSNTIFLTGEDYYNFDKRKEKLTAFVNSFINPDGKMSIPTSPLNNNSNASSSTTERACDPQNASYSVEAANVKMTLCKCYFQNSRVTCPVWLNNISPNIVDYYLVINGTRLIVDYGKEFPCTGGNAMNKPHDGNYIGAKVPVTKNGVPAQIVFEKVQTSSKAIESLELNIYGVGVRSFSDVPLVHGAPPQKQ